MADWPTVAAQHAKQPKGAAPGHHALIRGVRPWRGYLPGGFVANFLGVRTRVSMFSPASHPSMMPHPLRMRCTSMLPRFVRTQYPPFDEEYFEWIAVMEAASTAVGEFVMVELGAGWGRWLVNATAAIARTSGVPCRLVGVEADPTHFRWMGEHFRDNGIDVRAHEFIEAAVSDKDGEAWFYAGRPGKWYGQTFAKGPDPKAGWGSAPRWMRVNRVKMVTLDAVLRRYERVDLIDADIQGAELAVFSAARDVVDRRVRSVCVMTHEPPETIEAGLREIFRSLGWRNVADYSCGSLSETSWGKIRFRDGVQRWINPRLW